MKITEAVTQYISLEDQPLSVVDNKGFQLLLSLLKPRYEFLSHHHIRHGVTKAAQLWKSTSTACWRTFQLSASPLIFGLAVSAQCILLAYCNCAVDRQGFCISESRPACKTVSGFKLPKPSQVQLTRRGASPKCNLQYVLYYVTYSKSEMPFY